MITIFPKSLGVVRFIDVGDIHQADNPPSIRVAGYTEQIFNKLRFIGEAANDRSVDFILLKGDLFHQPVASRVSHRLTIAMTQMLKSFGIPILIVPGNHDLSKDRVDSIYEQPIGEVLEGLNTEFLGAAICGHVHFIGVPGIMSWKVQDIVEYFGSELKKFDVRNEDEVIVIAMHQAIATGMKPYEVIQASEFQGLADLITYGHEHYCGGFYRVGETAFLNLGAISRASIVQDDLSRQPKVGLVTVDGKKITVEEILIPCLPVADVYDFRSKDKEAELDANVIDFMRSVGETKFEVVRKSVV